MKKIYALLLLSLLLCGCSNTKIKTVTKCEMVDVDNHVYANAEFKSTNDIITYKDFYYVYTFDTVDQANDYKIILNNQAKEAYKDTDVSYSINSNDNSVTAFIFGDCITKENCNYDTEIKNMKSQGFICSKEDAN